MRRVLAAVEATLIIAMGLAGVAAIRWRVMENRRNPARAAVNPLPVQRPSPLSSEWSGV
jgi:hypothetical protein